MSAPTFADFAPSYTWRTVEHWLYDGYQDLALNVLDGEYVADLDVYKSSGKWVASVTIRGTGVSVARLNVRTRREAKVWCEEAARHVAASVPGRLAMLADHEARLAPYKATVREAQAALEAERDVHESESSTWEASVIASVPQPVPID